MRSSQLTFWLLTVGALCHAAVASLYLFSYWQPPGSSYLHLGRWPWLAGLWLLWPLGLAFHPASSKARLLVLTFIGVIVLVAPLVMIPTPHPALPPPQLPTPVPRRTPGV